MAEESDGCDVGAIASDPDALEAFYRRHVGLVQRFVARRVDDPYRAADLTADVFVAAIDNAHTFRSSRGDCGRWLYGVARNVVAAERRRTARERQAARRLSGRALIGDEDLAEIIDRIAAESQARQLYNAMEGLTEGDRGLFELIAIDGLAVHDAAKMLGMSPVAARVRLHRARRLLRELMYPRPASGSQIVMEEA